MLDEVFRLIEYNVWYIFSYDVYVIKYASFLLFEKYNNIFKITEENVHKH